MKYTDKEVRKMIYSFLKEEGNDWEDLASSCQYSIIEDYVSDSPAWCGDIITIVFGYAEAISNYKIVNNKIEKIIPVEYAKYND